MRCYCSAIARCESDIENVEQMIDILSDADYCNDFLNSTLLKTSDCTQGAITPKNINSLCSGIENGNAYVKPKIDAAKIECYGRLSGLRNLLYRMEKEDTAYHAMEDK